jgi:maleylacetate reductase
MSSFVFRSHTGVIHFGTGIAGDRLRGELDRLQWERPVLIASPRERARALSLGIVPFASLAGEFSAVRQHVPAETAAAARALAADVKADGVIALGGGSSTGLAKAIAVEAGLPAIAIPTTFSGSEVTPVWGVTTDRRKQTGTDPRAVPVAVIYDTELVSDLPDDIAVPSALNAMAHAVEALWTARRSPISDLFAVEAIRALAEGLRGRGGADDPAALERLLYGSLTAGLSFAAAGAGFHHKICHILGGTFDLPHAPLHAVILPWVVSFNTAQAPLTRSVLAGALGGTNPVAELALLYATSGAPRSLAGIGMARDDLPRAIEAVVAALPIENPRLVTPADVERLLTRAFAGPESA